MRLDKWLWAARWYKTRALASAAIKGGKIHVNQRAVKPAYPVAIGDQITVTQGPYRRIIDVLQLSERRGPAAEAARLYAETGASVDHNAQVRLTLKAQRDIAYQGSGRPTKRDRRAIIRFTDQRD